MNKAKLNKVIGDGNIVIPLYILKYFKSLNVSMEEFVFLMYLYNKQDNLDFNPEKISQDLNIDIMEVMGYVSTLTDKGYLNLEIKKTENNILEEVINLNNFYEKISMLLINTEVVNNDTNTLYEFIEKELGRPLNSLEIKTIEGWINNNISEDLIKEALKVALNDGVYSLKFIDKILIDWSNRGYQKIEDIQKKIPLKEETPEMIDWNWLDDEEEYIIN